MTRPPVDVCRTLTELRATLADWRAQGLRIGFVPTMGALHEGHLSLVHHALQNADRVVASIFVNPTQFAAHEDLDTYPRTEETDLAAFRDAGCHLAYCPDPMEMYQPGEETRVKVPTLGARLEGEFRPHFFGGVATVVTRLFIHVMPDLAVFGEKDFQQVAIIRRMTRDLGFPIDILAAPTVREASGLAMSSRNAYLTADQRRAAPALFASLHRAALRIRAGTAVSVAMAEAYIALDQAGFQKIDYLAACAPDTLLPLPLGPLAPDTPARLLGAAWLGKTRLIDNFGV